MVGFRAGCQVGVVVEVVGRCIALACKGYTTTTTATATRQAKGKGKGTIKNKIK